MALKKGMAAVRESLERNQRPSGGSNKFEKTNWFGWKAGETKVLRFLTDDKDILIVPVHENVENHQGQKRTFVCRQAFDVDCELCEAKAYRREIGYGLAVLREPVYEEVDDQKKMVSYKDATETYETEVDGKTVTKKRPYVGIVSQGLRNFWSNIALINEKYGSLKDRDIEIVRQGAGVDTQYMPFALDKKEIENIDARYAPFLPKLEEFLTRIGSEEYYQAQIHGVTKEKAQTSTSTETFEDEYEDDDYLDFNEETEADRLRKKLNGN